ncbi:MAG TPA: hypothetical protein VFZ32_17310 [Micromonosporaceae bacterium]
MRTTEWVIGVAALVVGIVLAGVAMVGMGLSLLWTGSLEPQAEATRPWWLWLVFPAPPVLMALGGLLVRRAGASVPVALGIAGLIGILVGIGYLAVAYAIGR